MNLIYIRDYSPIEGIKFWRKYALVGDFLNIKQLFWEKYPKVYKKILINKNKRGKHQQKDAITLNNKSYILKVVPQIDFYVSNNTHVSSVGKMVKEFIKDLDRMNKKVFFTLKGYNEYLSEKIEALNLYNFSRFNFQPQEDLSDVQDFRVWPSLLSDERNKSMYRSAILANKPESLLKKISPLNRPIRITNIISKQPRTIRISDYEGLPGYKKKRIFKLFGKRSSEPLNEGKRIPNFINPTYITVEYSPFIDDENKYLKTLASYFDKYSQNWNLYRNDVIDIVNFIYHLINDDLLVKKRSKMDILVEYIKTHKTRIYTLNLVRTIYNYLIITKDFKVDNGLYVVRRNNKLSNFVHCVKFDKIEFWGHGEYLDARELVQNYNEKHYYYFCSPNHKNFRLLPFLVVDNPQKIQSQTSAPPPQNLKKMRKILKKDSLGYLRTIYIIKKRYYYSDEVMVDINFQTRSLVGTVRVKGVKIVYITK